MKFLKLLLVLGLLCKTIQGNISIFQDDDECTCEGDSWEKRLQKLVGSCNTSAYSFPGEARELGVVVVASFSAQTNLLIGLAESESSLLQLCAEIMGRSLGNAEIKGDGMAILSQINDQYFDHSGHIIEAAKKLLKFIGYKLIRSFTNGVGEFRTALLQYLEEFIRNCRYSNCKEKIDFSPVLRKYQCIIDVVARSQKLVEDSRNEVTKETCEAVFILHLFLWDFTIIVTAVQSCVSAALQRHNCPVSEPVKHCSLSFENILDEITNLFNGVDSISKESVTNLVKNLLNIISVIGDVIGDLLGGVIGNVDNLLNGLLG